MPLLSKLAEMATRIFVIDRCAILHRNIAHVFRRSLKARLLQVRRDEVACDFKLVRRYTVWSSWVAL